MTSTHEILNSTSPTSTIVNYNSFPILNTYDPNLFLRVVRYLKAADICDLLQVNKNLRKYRDNILVIEGLFEKYAPFQLGIGPNMMLNILKDYSEKKNKEYEIRLQECLENEDSIEIHMENAIIRNFNPCYCIQDNEKKDVCIQFVAFKSIPNLVIHHLSFQGLDLTISQILNCLYESSPLNSQTKSLTFKNCKIPAATFLLLAGAFQSLESFSISGCEIIPEMSGSDKLSENKALIELISKNPFLKKLTLLDIAISEDLFDVIFNNFSKILESFKINKIGHLDETVLKEFVISFPNLEELEFKDIPLNKESLMLFPQMWPKLKILNITNNKCVDNNFFQLLSIHCPDLEELVLENCQPNVSLNLTTINNNVPSNGVSDLAIDMLAKGCKRLKILNLINCFQITNLSLESIAIHCSDLTEIYLDKCIKITSIGIKKLATHAKKLETLCIRECKHVKNDAIDALADGLKNLKIVDLSQNSNFIDESVLKLLTNVDLEKFFIKGCDQLSDILLYKLIEKSPALEILHCDNCPKISHRAINHILLNGVRITDFQYDKNVFERISHEEEQNLDDLFNLENNEQTTPLYFNTDDQDNQSSDSMNTDTETESENSHNEYDDEIGLTSSSDQESEIDSDRDNPFFSLKRKRSDND